MTLAMDSTTRASVNTATDLTDYANKLNTAIGGAGKRVRCFRNSVEFRNCAINGSFTVTNNALYLTGTLNGTTISNAADLTTGSSTLRIQNSSGSQWIEGTLGLSGTDFIVDSSFTTNNGLAFKATCKIVGPASLPPQPDTTPPTISIVASPSNVTTESNVTITATTADNVGVDHVEFYRNSTLISTVTSSPWVANDPMTYASNAGQTYTYTAKSYDAAGNHTTSNSQVVTINIPNPNPTAIFSTLTISNTSGSTVPSNFITECMGQPFKKGDIPSGFFPRYELSNGTAVPYTPMFKTTWSDGSLKFMACFLRVPSTIAGSGSITLNIRGSAVDQGSSSRTLSDLSSGSADLKVSLTGLDNLSGTWISQLNQGVIDNDDILVLGDGPVGKVWRIRQQFMQSGSNHGQLECYWYVAALQDSSGGLYGLRVLGRVTQPWYDIDTPTKTWRSFSAVTLNNGASLIRDLWANHSTAKPFTYSSGSTINCSSHGFETGVLIRASGTTLPGGLTAGTSVFALANTANTLSFYTNGQGPISGGGNITLSGSASGDAVVQGYPYITHFGGFFTAGSNGRWDYVQAGGSVASDATTRLVKDKHYWVSTGVIPAYDLSITPASQTGYNYEPNTMGPITRNTNTTGERADIGVMPSWHVHHILSQSANDEQVTRVTGLALAQVAIHVLNSTTKTMGNGSGRTYSGMPAANTNFRWDASTSHTTGFTNPSGTFTLAGVATMSLDHFPSLEYYPYVLTGEPQYLDMLIEMGSNAICHRYPVPGTATSTNIGASRNPTINGTTYSATTIGDGDTLREDAWSTRDVGVAAGLLPDSPPQGATLKQYFIDSHEGTYAAMANYNANVATSFWRTAGMMHFRQNGGAHISDPWMSGYMCMQMATMAKLCDSTAVLTQLNHMVKWFDFLYTNFGAWSVPGYEVVARVSDAANSAYISSVSQVAFYGININGDSSTSLFTLGSTSNGWTPANGDQIMFENTNIRPTPGFTAFVRYFIINKSGSTCQLSATSGGSAISITPLSLTWDSGTGLFTYASFPNGFAIGSNDKVIFRSGTAPAGFTAGTVYYPMNISGQTFKLSLTPGSNGTAITLTDTQATPQTVDIQPVSQAAFFVAVSPPSTNTIEGNLGPAAYINNNLGACRLATAAGATVNQSMISDWATRATGTDFTTDPRYKFAATYNQ